LIPRGRGGCFIFFSSQRKSDRSLQPFQRRWVDSARRGSVQPCAELGFVRRHTARTMNTPLKRDEATLKTGGASLQRGIETVGGKLYLTNRRLIFESHAFNVQRGATLIPLGDISSITKCWTKLLNLIPLMPNSLAVTTTQGREHRFVLFGRDAWASAITSAKSA